MKASFEKQNISMIVKDGVKLIKNWIEHINDGHEEIIVKETAYQQTVQTAEKDRQERNKVRNRAQAQLVNNIVLQNEKANLKRARDPRDEDKLERQP